MEEILANNFINAFMRGDPEWFKMLLGRRDSQNIEIYHPDEIKSSGYFMKIGKYKISLFIHMEKIGICFTGDDGVSLLRIYNDLSYKFQNSEKNVEGIFPNNGTEFTLDDFTLQIKPKLYDVKIIIGFENVITLYPRYFQDELTCNFNYRYPDYNIDYSLYEGYLVSFIKSNVRFNYITFNLGNENCEIEILKLEKEEEDYDMDDYENVKLSEQEMKITYSLNRKATIICIENIESEIFTKTFICEYNPFVNKIKVSMLQEDREQFLFNFPYSLEYVFNSELNFFPFMDIIEQHILNI